MCTISDNSVSYLVPGTQLYLWVFNHANPAQATQWGIFTASGWLAPQALGSQALSTTSAMQVVQGSLVSQQLRLRDIPVSYGNWTWQSYPGNSTTQTTGPTADPDGDGLANLAEYAWKLNPNASDTTRTTLAKATDGSVIFHFKSPRNIPDVTVSVECATDLNHERSAVPGLCHSGVEYACRVRGHVGHQVVVRPIRCVGAGDGARGIRKSAPMACRGARTAGIRRSP